MSALGDSGTVSIYLSCNDVKAVRAFSEEMSQCIQPYMYNNRKSERRSKGLIFENLMDGKAAEFAVWRWLSSNGIESSKPDCKVYGPNSSDDGDLIVSTECRKVSIAVKASKASAQYLLVHDGVYSSFDVGVFCRVAANREKVELSGWVIKRDLRRYALAGDWLVDSRGRALTKLDANNYIVHATELRPMRSLVEALL